MLIHVNNLSILLAVCVCARVLVLFLYMFFVYVYFALCTHKLNIMTPTVSQPRG